MNDIDVEVLQLDTPVRATATGTRVFVKGTTTFETPKLSLAWDCTVRENTFGTRKCILPLLLRNKDDDFKWWLRTFEERIRTLLRDDARTVLGAAIGEAYLERPFLVMEPPSMAPMALFLPSVEFDADTSHIVTPIRNPQGASLDATVLKQGLEVVATVSLAYIQIGKNNNVTVHMKTEKICTFEPGDWEFDM